MINVKNQKPISRLAYKSFKNSKTRNIFAIIAIALTSILFTTLFTLSISTVDNFQRQTMRMAGGDGHAALKYLTDEQFNAVKSNKLIDKIAYDRILCDKVNNQELLKRHGELWYYDDVGLELGFSTPTSGKRPIADNDIMMDTITMKLLGIPEEIGSKVTLNYDVHGKNVERDFVLSGWWEGDTVFNASILLTSRAYVDKYADELYNSYKEDFSLTGAINSIIMFKNTFDLQGKLDTLIAESGFSSDENAPNYVNSNLNWSYVSSNMSFDIVTIIGIIAALSLIVFTGYLIIYNIFQISVINDIKFYGLLKTIGTTSRQIKKIIAKQTLLLSAFGIPIGLLIGFLLGKQLVPLVIEQSSYSAATVDVNPNPFIFIASAVFAVITVIISTRKPAKIASSVSPVEAVRYTESSRNKKGIKKTTNGGKLHNMALSNLGRNKKRTFLVIISMSLSLVILNTVFTVTSGFSMDKYLSKFVDMDFTFKHANVENNTYTGNDDKIDLNTIKMINELEGFQAGGSIYYNENYVTSEYSEIAGTNMINKIEDNSYLCSIYGLEDILIDRLDVVEGDIDLEKLKTGDYIFQGISIDDNGKPTNNGNYKIGDKVKIAIYQSSDKPLLEREKIFKEYTVMANVKIKPRINSSTRVSGNTYFLHHDEYKNIIKEPTVMMYSFNASNDKINEINSFLKNYTETIEPTYAYNSKLTYMNSFNSLISMFTIIGGALGVVIAFIGILNFINSTLTGIITRKQEFAMMQSIGMTNKQLNVLLITEGLYYTVFTIITAFVLSILSSLLIVKGIISSLWFFDYKFIIMPLFILIPILLIMGILVPKISLKFSGKQSIVERLRDNG